MKIFISYTAMTRAQYAYDDGWERIYDNVILDIETPIESILDIEKLEDRIQREHYFNKIGYVKILNWQVL